MGERCPRCEKEYAGGRPSNFGSDPGCAFVSGVFSGDNWNCITANALRDATRQDEEDSRSVWSDDQFAALLPWEGEFIVLSWYKHRGRTEGAWVISSGETHVLTLAEAEAYLDGKENPDRD